LIVARMEHCSRPKAPRAQPQPRHDDAHAEHECCETRHSEPEGAVLL
jgi:hypothetical protein